MNILEVRDLTISFPGLKRGEEIRVVDSLSFDVADRACTGLVGESGCGKSMTSLAIMGLLPPQTKTSGHVFFNGVDLLALSPRERRRIRGRDISMIFQDPMSALNPVIRIEVQIVEVLKRHRGLRGEQARKEAVKLLEKVGIPDPQRCVHQYPHELSGGMRQRVLIAISLACSPRLLIADEPTTALDVTVQAQILDLLSSLMQETGSSMIMITHDMGVISQMCHHVNIMYAGRLVESAATKHIFANPRHRYTEGLLNSIVDPDHPKSEALKPIRGSIHNRIPWSDGCAFAPRCPNRRPECVGSPITLTQTRDSVFRCVNPCMVRFQEAGQA